MTILRLQMLYIAVVKNFAKLGILLTLLLAPLPTQGQIWYSDVYGLDDPEGTIIPLGVLLMPTTLNATPRPIFVTYSETDWEITHADLDGWQISKYNAASQTWQTSTYSMFSQSWEPNLSIAGGDGLYLNYIGRQSPGSYWKLYQRGYKAASGTKSLYQGWNFLGATYSTWAGMLGVEQYKSDNFNGELRVLWYSDSQGNPPPSPYFVWNFCCTILDNGAVYKQWQEQSGF
jgi:hypothetical protein